MVAGICHFPTHSAARSGEFPERKWSLAFLEKSFAHPLSITLE
jgi:hypothetical protein